MWEDKDLLSSPWSFEAKLSGFLWKRKLEIQNTYPVLVRYNKIWLDPKLLKFCLKL